MIDITNIQNKLYNSLKPSGWDALLKGFMLSNDFKEIISTLYEQTLDGKRFTPVVADMFAAFRECPYNGLTTVFVTEEPFTGINESNGIAFDSSRCKYEHPVTTALLKEVNSAIYPNREYLSSRELKSWSEQGILLLHANLTAQIDKPGSHTIIWKPFTGYLLDMLNSYKHPLVFVFFGQETHKLASIIKNPHHVKFTTEYPGKLWISGNLFNRVEQFVHEHHNKKIIW